MSIALREFLGRLVEAGVTDADGCRRLAVAYRKSTGKLPSEARSLATFLVRHGQITEFEAGAMLGVAPPRLRIGPFVRTGRTGPPPLQHWIPVRRREDGQRGVLAVVSAERADADFRSRLQAHLQIDSPHLQPLECVPHRRGGFLLFSALPAGRSLGSRPDPGGAENDATDPAGRSGLARDIGCPLLDAIEAFHRAGRSPGPLAAKWVWLTDDGRVMLLRDPVKSDGPAPNGPSPADPERDLYRLGELLCRLEFGPQLRLVDRGGEARVSPAEMPALVRAIRSGSTGDPLHRVLAHAVSANPKARFSTVAEFRKAYEAAIGALPRTPARAVTAPPQRAVTPPTPPEPPQPVPGPGRMTLDSPRPVPERVEASDSPEAPVVSEVPVVSGADIVPTEPGTKSRGDATPNPTAAANSDKRPGPRRRPRKRPLAPWVLGGLGFLVLLLVIAVLAYEPGPATPGRRGPRPTIAPPPAPRVAANVAGRESAAGPAAPEIARGYELADDPRLLWAPPYPSGTPAPRELLPPGAGVIATFRLSRWIQDSGGRDLLEAFSPEWDRLAARLRSRTGVDVESIRRLSVALHPGDQGWPEISLAVVLETPADREDLLRRWQVQASRTPEGHTIFAGDDPEADAYFLRSVAGDDSRVAAFAVGGIRRISEVADLEGRPGPLSQPMARAWNGSSDAADFTLLATPNFLFADARRLLKESAPALEQPLRDALIPDVSAWLVTATLGDDRLYAEMRAMPAGEIRGPELVRRWGDALARSPRWAEEFLVRSVPDPSWRLLATRLPMMLRFMNEQRREAIIDQAAVMNLYLPTRGAAQLGLGVLLAANSPGGSGPAAMDPPAAPAMTLDDMLDRTMSVSFAQESLQFAVEAVLEDFGRNLPRGVEPPVARILGGDLEKMGITQNQQVRDFERRDSPLRQVLTDLMLGANPDRTASGPDDPKQSLVWVVADDPENPGRRAILITTREAAADRYELPREFRQE